MSVPLRRLKAANSVLIVVDVQDKLLVKIPTAAALVKNVNFLLDAAKILEVPAIGTEQYPKGLGPTHPKVARRLPSPIPSKTAFSCCGAENFLEGLTLLQRPNVVLTGMESHVCVLHTALDLLQAGMHVFLPVDALASRNAIDHDFAIRRLEQAGAVPTTVEAIAFEWTEDATHPQFKAVSKLVIDRSS